MKVIFPRFAWFALAAMICAVVAGLARAQTNNSPPTMSLAPQENRANVGGNSAGGNGASGWPSTGNMLNGVASTNSAPANGPATNTAGMNGAAAQPNVGQAQNTSAAQNIGAEQNGAEMFIGRVAAATNQLQSVQARIRYRANLFGTQNVGAGLYLQQGIGEDRKFRLELKTAIGEQKLLTFQQVCDGKFLWQYRDSFNKQGPDKLAPAKPGDDAADRPTITRIDLVKVRQTLQDSDRKFTSNALGQLAFGGLPKLLDGLQKSFRFNRVEAGHLDTLPVWTAVGSWSPEGIAFLSKDLADQAAHDQPLNLKLLPPQLPEQVWLYVGQDDLFPYRIEYRRRTGQGRGGETGQGEMVPIVTVEFYEVRLNAPINPHEFDYQPGNADIVDNTASYIKEAQGK
jgi:outer membrane lipoprotein-sorting protein